eukprot:scaffold102185_cov13-Tisochrysis_lutea.AAC.2
MQRACKKFGRGNCQALVPCQTGGEGAADSGAADSEEWHLRNQDKRGVEGCHTSQGQDRDELP